MFSQALTLSPPSFRPHLYHTTHDPRHTVHRTPRTAAPLHRCTAHYTQAAERAFVRARGSVLAVSLVSGTAVRHCYRGHVGGGGGTKPVAIAVHACSPMRIRPYIV